MKLALYQKAVTRTLPDLGDIPELSMLDPELKKILSLKLNLAHMTLGVASELSELEECLVKSLNTHSIDYVNLGEEIGDKLWYACNWANLLNITIDEKYVFADNFDFDFDLDIRANIIIYGGMLADIAKRFLAYGHSLDLQEEIRKSKSDKKYISNEEILMRYISSCYIFCTDFNLNIEDIMYKNISKLYVRYKDKFTSDEALMRDLEAERISLEKE